MSTIGGSRGERNAKPKFSALDINSLYRTSRGESLEPSAQKNAVPRKHGMQILGKVPSARRPPANLPSLKAETSTPESGTWTGANDTATTPTNANSQPTQREYPDKSSNLNNNTGGGNISNSGGGGGSNIEQHQSTKGASTQYQNKHSAANNSYNSNNSNHNSSSASWSAVATGSGPKESPISLYQSPQFQHEFPSLDGSSAPAQSKGSRGGVGPQQQHDSHSTGHTNSGSNNNNNANDIQMNAEQNRTQTDMQAQSNQQQSPAGKDGNSQSSHQAQVLQQVVPPQFRALMPQFLLNSTEVQRLMVNSAEISQHQQQNRESNVRMGRSGDSRENYHQSYRGGHRDRNDERSYRRGPPSRSNRHDYNVQYDDQPVGFSSIIREEEMDRLDQLDTDDGWAQDVDIDYNQKLVFSDDDSDTPPPISSNKNKRVNFNEKEKEAKALQIQQRKEEQAAYKREQREPERETVEREQNDRNDRDKMGARMQQNGHRSGAPVLDPETLERIKQRKEQEEKREYERKMAAARKLQELEQKINKKKEMLGDNEIDSGAASSAAAEGRYKQQSGSTFPGKSAPSNEFSGSGRSDDGKIRDGKDSRDYDSRNRYDSKYERDAPYKDRDYRDRGERDARSGGAANAADGSFFNKPFQANLPPRFQKQRQDQDQRPSYNERSNERDRRDGRDGREDRGGYSSNRGVQHNIRRPVNTQSMQSHSNKRSPDDVVLARRGADIPGGNRKRFDSEEDDRFSSGRESVSRNSVGERPTQLARSISDSSQRKTSVSSEDKPLDSSMRSERSSESREKIGSWADEVEEKGEPIPILKSQHSNTSSGSMNDDNAPKQILQRVRKVSIESRSDKEKSEEREFPAKTLNQSHEDVSLGTSPDYHGKPLYAIGQSDGKSSGPTGNNQANRQTIACSLTMEAPKSWADSTPTTPEIARKSTENLSDSSSVKASDGDKKLLERVLENEPGSGGESKGDDKLASKHRGYSKDAHSSDDGKHSKRPSARGGRQDSRAPALRGYGSSYRGGNSWSNRRGGGRSGGRYNDYSDSEGSDDEYHSRGNRKDDRYKQDSGGRRDSQQSQQKEAFVPRGEPSRRGRGGISAFTRRPGPPVVKRIDNYGPPNTKTPFGAGDDKSDKESGKSQGPVASTDDKVKQNQSLLNAGLNKAIDPAKPSGKRSDEFSESTSELSDSQDKSKAGAAVSKPVSSTAPIATKPDDKKVQGVSAPKPFTSSSQSLPQRKDSTGQKPEFATKADDKTIGAQQPPKSGHSSSSEKLDKNAPIKKDETSYSQGQRSGAPSSNRGKPQQSTQSSVKSPPQASTVKPSAGSVSKPGNTATNQPQATSLPPQAQVNVPAGPQQQSAVKPAQDRSSTSVNRAGNQPPNKMAPRFVKQQRDRNGPNQSNTWEKTSGDISQIGDAGDDFTQRSAGGAQSVDKITSDGSNKGEPTKMSTIIFENTNFKSMPPGANADPMRKRPTGGNYQQSGNPNQQTQQSQQQTPQNHHLHHSQQSAMGPAPHQQHSQSQQHHLDKKQDSDLIRDEKMSGYPDKMLPYNVQQQQQLQSQVQRPHQSQADSITSALQTMSFPKNDAEYEKDLKLAFLLESEILNEDKDAKGSLCIPPSRSSAIHSVPTGQNTISPSIADLSKKIGSVKKVWENAPSMPTVMEHANTSSGSNDDSHLSSTFVSSQHQQHMHQFNPHSNMSHVHALSPAPGSYSNSFGQEQNSLEHFGKSGGNDGDIDNVGYNPSPQHIVGAGSHNSHQNAALKHGNDSLSSRDGNICKVKPNPQQLHQSSLGLSPPPMQQGAMQAAPQPYYQPSQFGGISAIPSPPAVLYNSSPMPSQGNLYGHFQLEPNRSQFSQYPAAHYGAAGNAPYNAYMPSGPNLQAAPTPDMYAQGITSQYRMGGAVQQPPYNQTQQLNNQSTVLISSSSNSLMSASVKPSSQQIGAIGTKAGAVGQSPYGQQYMSMYAAPPQQPPPQNIGSSSYYSSSAGGQGTFFGAPAGAGGNYAGMFGGPQTQPPSNLNNQQVANYNSQFLNSPLLTINRQYQGGPTPQAPYSQQQQSRNSQQQQQQNPNQSQSQSAPGQPSSQQPQQQSNNQNQSAPQHGDAVSSNSFFK